MTRQIMLRKQYSLHLSFPHFCHLTLPCFLCVSLLAVCLPGERSNCLRGEVLPTHSHLTMAGLWLREDPVLQCVWMLRPELCCHKTQEERKETGKKLVLPLSNRTAVYTCEKFSLKERTPASGPAQSLTGTEVLLSSPYSHQMPAS